MFGALLYMAQTLIQEDVIINNNKINQYNNYNVLQSLKLNDVDVKCF